jgi:hypothetical protein
MSPLYKILLVIAHATSVALIVIPQVLPSFALAKTIARSSQSRNMAVHYVKERSVRARGSKNSKLKAVVSHNLHPNPANVSYHPEAHTSPRSHVTAGAYGRSGDININTIVNDIDVLNGYYVKTYNNAQTLSMHSISLLKCRAKKLRLVQSRIPLKHQLQNRRANTNFNRVAPPRSRTFTLTLEASRQHSIEWALTRASHTMMNTTPLKPSLRI